LDFSAPLFEIKASIKAKVCYLFCFIFHHRLPPLSTIADQVKASLKHYTFKKQLSTFILQ